MAMATQELMMALTVVCMLTVANGHGSMVTPRSRNSIDYLAHVNTQWCSNMSGAECNNGQASFWYSQGCFIGCPYCDHTSGRRQTDLCGLGFNATNNDPLTRSVNRNVTAGAFNDIYRHNPWRAPGSAPIADACGLAGGSPWGADGAEEGVYVNTTYAHHGMKGTDLPPMPTGVVWTIGGEATVSWNVRNNHGGGYQYRLCPAFEPLTEECFQTYPLEFVQDKQAIVFPNGTTVAIMGTFINTGTLPVGSTWAMLPIPPAGLGPRCLPGPTDIMNGTNATKDGCQKWEGRDDGQNGHVDGPCVPCPETPGSDCSRCDNRDIPAFAPPLPGLQGSPEPGVVDVLRVPHLPAGDYVLSFRYDCEATAQVWSNCADVTLSA